MRRPLEYRLNDQEMRFDAKNGLTLPELLVLLVCLLLAASIIVPAVTGSMSTPSYLRLAHDAGGIYTQIFAAATENTTNKINYWPSTQPDPQYESYSLTSTDYFRWLLTPYDIKYPEKGAGVLQQDWSVFHADGLAEISFLDDLTSVTNPCCVVANVSETTSSGTPFMISKNVNEARLQVWDRPQDPLENVGVRTYDLPFGDEMLIVVRMGGGAEVLNRKQFFWDLLNPNQEIFPILQP